MTTANEVSVAEKGVYVSPTAPPTETKTEIRQDNAPHVSSAQPEDITRMQSPPPSYYDGTNEKGGVPSSEQPQQQHQPQAARVTPIPNLTEGAAQVDCPFCKTQAQTTTRKESGNTAMAWGACICLLAGCIFAWIPCVMDSCKDTVHQCSNCGKTLATVTNSGNVKVVPGAAPTVQSQYVRRPENMSAAPQNAR